MEILSDETIRAIVSVVKIAFVFAGIVIITTHFFYAKETQKMERKLQIYLPGSVRSAITIELILALFFLLFSLFVLFLAL